MQELIKIPWLTVSPGDINSRLQRHLHVQLGNGSILNDCMAELICLTLNYGMNY